VPTTRCLRQPWTRSKSISDGHGCAVIRTGTGDRDPGSASGGVRGIDRTVRLLGASTERPVHSCPSWFQHETRRRLRDGSTSSVASLHSSSRRRAASYDIASIKRVRMGFVFATSSTASKSSSVGIQGSRRCRVRRAWRRPPSDTLVFHPPPRMTGLWLVIPSSTKNVWKRRSTVSRCWSVAVLMPDVLDASWWR
jgi:hypothetical protein